jgi:hypothetical protein
MHADSIAHKFQIKLMCTNVVRANVARANVFRAIFGVLMSREQLSICPFMQPFSLLSWFGVSPLQTKHNKLSNSSGPRTLHVPLVFVLFQ